MGVTDGVASVSSPLAASLLLLLNDSVKFFVSLTDILKISEEIHVTGKHDEEEDWADGVVHLSVVLLMLSLWSTMWTMLLSSWAVVLTVVSLWPLLLGMKSSSISLMVLSEAPLLWNVWAGWSLWSIWVKGKFSTLIVFVMMVVTIVHGVVEIFIHKVLDLGAWASHWWSIEWLWSGECSRVELLLVDLFVSVTQMVGRERWKAMSLILLLLLLFLLLVLLMLVLMIMIMVSMRISLLIMLMISLMALHIAVLLWLGLWDLVGWEGTASTALHQRWVLWEDL